MKMERHRLVMTILGIAALIAMTYWFLAGPASPGTP